MKCRQSITTKVTKRTKICFIIFFVTFAFFVVKIGEDMEKIFFLLIICALASMQSNSEKSPASQQTRKGVLLEDLSWIEAEKLLTDKAVVVIPLGAASKEHGPHLRLKNDFIYAEYLKKRVLEKADVIVAPTINYSFYPAFLEYPGSTSLRFETARDLAIDVCRSIAAHGPRRFYILNTGVSTKRPLQAAAEMLASEGIIMQYTDTLKILGEVEKTIKKQEGGTHADEIETSMILYIDPSAVDMSKAVKDYHPDKGPLTRNPNGAGTYSATGIWGDPTLATREKGEKLVEALVEGILKDIEELSRKSIAKN